MSLAILFHFLCAQYVSDINISIINSVDLPYWSIVLGSMCVGDSHPNPATLKLQHTSNQEQ